MSTVPPAVRQRGLPPEDQPGVVPGVSGPTSSDKPVDPVERMKAIQQMLKDAGYDPGAIDGQQGPRTTAAIKQFQRANGLAVDGIVGPQTIAVLQSAPGFAPEGPSSSVTSTSGGGLNVVPSAPTAADAGAGTGPAGAGPSPKKAKSYLAVSPEGHYRFDPKTGQVTQDIAPDNPQLDAEIRTNYGYESWMLDVPELKTIIYQAVAGGKDDAWVQGQLQQTQWYNTHSAKQRAWIEKAANDSGEARDELQRTINRINAESVNLGVTIQPDRVAGMAQQILENALNPEEVRQLLVHEGKFNLAHPTGTAAEALVRFRRIAAEYLLKVPDETLQNFMRDSMKQGRVDSSGFEAYAQSQSQQMYPWLKSLMAGNPSLTPNQAVEPYRQNIAKTLEINPDTVDFTDAKWQRAILQADPKTGAVTPAPVYAMDQTLRTDRNYGWQFTKTANDQADALVSRVLNNFGETP